MTNYQSTSKRWSTFDTRLTLHLSSLLRALLLCIFSLIYSVLQVKDNPLDELPRSFRDPTSAEVLAWVRREHVFFGAAVAEWDGHEGLYVTGELSLHHFLEQVVNKNKKGHYFFYRTGKNVNCARRRVYA